MEKQGLIFITGGARSGKSAFAERCAVSLASENDENLYYIATSEATDAEMRERIAYHQHDRKESGYNWHTLECPVDLAACASSIQEKSVVLLDCLTILLTNELFQDGFMEATRDSSHHQQRVRKAILTGISAIQAKAKTLLVVSNEVLHENVLDASLVETYSRLLGGLHREMVEKAAEAYLLEAGIPVLMKGRESNAGDHDSRDGL